MKISEARGNFLLEDPKIHPTPSHKKSVVAKEKLKICVVQDTTISSNLSPIETEKTYLKSQRNDNNQPDSTTAGASHFKHALDQNNFVIPQKTGFMRNNGDNIDEEIARILQWNIKWLIDQNKSDISPPVYQDLQLRPIPNVFTDHREYVNVMTPLVFLELWQFIYQSFRHGEETRYEHLMHDCACIL